jgi:two-component system sensor histidine kinase KdpD
MPKTPEEWLAVSEPPQKTKGTLKLFLGYAPGVGKTFSMLSEAIREKKPRRRPCDRSRRNARKKGNRRAWPRSSKPSRAGKSITKARFLPRWTWTESSPEIRQVVLVDELAHTNIPGSKHRKRYEDVLEIIDANIDVISTVNIQHIESIAPTVRAITGVAVRETVPDWVLQVSTKR